MNDKQDKVYCSKQVVNMGSQLPIAKKKVTKETEYLSRQSK